MMTLRAIPVDFASTWNDLSEVCCKVIRCEWVSSARWNSSFPVVYKLIVSRPESHGSKLYEEIEALIKNRICEIVDNLTQLDNDSLLSSYVVNWELFHRGLGYLDMLLTCVNTNYVKSMRPTEADMCYGETLPTAEKHNMEIMQLGLSQWKIYLIDQLKTRLTSCLMIEVTSDRNGIQSHQNCIVTCLESFLRVDELKGLTKVSLNVYLTLFEIPLLEETRTCFTNWASLVQSTQSCTDYVVQALALRTDEIARAKKYYIGSLTHVENLFKDIVVQQRLDFLNTSIPQFVQDEDKTALHNILMLLLPSGKCGDLFKSFGSHVKVIVSETIANLPIDQNLAPNYFVDSLLAVRHRFVTFINEVFDGLSPFRNEMDKAFEQAINSIPKNPSQVLRPHIRTAEYLSRYMDSLLRRSTKQLTEAELEAKLTASITLFKYIEDKDIFRKYYQKNLCHRLIFGSTTFLEMEESAINQLNAVCGYEFTSKFHRMFTDIQLLPELNANFQQYLTKNNLTINFANYCNVLTMSAWPINLKTAPHFSLPSELAEVNSNFETFYTTSFNGRKLRWANSHSTVELRACYTEKPYTFNLASINAAVLLLFERFHVDILTVREISSALQVPSTTITDDKGATSTTSTPLEDDTLRRAVLPLIDANILVLENADVNIVLTNADVNPSLPSSTTEESSASVVMLGEDMTVRLNHAYSNKRLKVKVNFFPQAKESTPDDTEQVEKQVEEDRRFFTQAAIVRIMKSRKTCKHNMLIKSVIDLAKGRFQPAVPLIKRCIENLIEKSYLERCPDDAYTYNYLA